MECGVKKSLKYTSLIMNFPSSVNSTAASPGASRLRLPLPKIDNMNDYKKHERTVGTHQFGLIKTSLDKKDGAYILDKPVWTVTSKIWDIVGLVYYVSSRDGNQDNLVINSCF
jgi:hypothetical protein